jgi:hypothetical protein
VLVLEPLDVARAREPAERDGVGAVGGEEMLDEHAAARTERHPRAMEVLIRTGLGVEHAAVHLRSGIADRHLAHDARRADVLLEERR